MVSLEEIITDEVRSWEEEYQQNPEVQKEHLELALKELFEEMVARAMQESDNAVLVGKHFTWIHVEFLSQKKLDFFIPEIIANNPQAPRIGSPFEIQFREMIQEFRRKQEEIHEEITSGKRGVKDYLVRKIKKASKRHPRSALGHFFGPGSYEKAEGKTEELIALMWKKLNEWEKGIQ